MQLFFVKRRSKLYFKFSPILDGFNVYGICHTITCSSRKGLCQDFLTSNKIHQYPIHSSLLEKNFPQSEKKSFLKQGCIPVGCVPPTCWPYPSIHWWGVSARGGVCQGVSAQGCVADTPRTRGRHHLPPRVNRMTERQV